MSTTEIENLLRQAPQPRPPVGLKERLKAEASRADFHAKVAIRPPRSASGWSARWWPALAPAAASLACAAVLTVQNFDIQELKTKLQALPQNAVEPGAAAATTSSIANENIAGAGRVASEAEEVARLKALVAKLTAEVLELEQLRAENERLRQQAAVAQASVLSAEEAKALEDSAEANSRIQCINNMKQLGLAARIWANDNSGSYPPGLLSMTNEMSTPKVLVCPGDSSRQAAVDWASFTTANCSYEYFAASGTETEPERVMFRCPIHGSITLCDGSVQADIAKTHPDWLIQRDGKLYFRVIAEIQFQK